jgi:hypothetical protein
MANNYFDQQNEYCDRDRPLSFHWHVPELISLLGLPPVRNAYEAARAAILAEAILAWESGQRVSYSARREFHSDGWRYRGTSFTYATVLWAIADLNRAGWIADDRVPPGNLGWQSSFVATDALIDRYHSGVCGIVYTAGEIICLRELIHH